ncbi:MAG: thioredoxin family protein [Planctomycetota bacterium]
MLPALVCAVVLSTALFAQGLERAAVAPPSPTATELQVRRADKLAQPFLRTSVWHTDLESAQGEAARSGKLILVHCTRSYTPCGTSIRCERDVLSSPEFAAFADEVVLHVHVTSHVDVEEDRRLSAWRGSGFPHHVVLDATGRVLGTHESHRSKSVAAFRELVVAAKNFLELEAATKEQEAQQRKQRLQNGLATGALTLAEARALMAASGTWTAEELEAASNAITDLEVAQVLMSIVRDDPPSQREAGRAFVAMHRMGKRPLARNFVRDFYGAILLHQEQAESPDLELCRGAMRELEERFANERGYRAFLSERRAELGELEVRTAATREGDSKAPSTAPAGNGNGPTKTGAGGGT